MWGWRRLSVCGAPAGGGGLGPGQIPGGIRGRVWPQARPDSQWESAGAGVSKAQRAGVRPHWGRLKCIGVGCGALGQLNNLPQWGLTCPSRWFPAPMRRRATLGDAGRRGASGGHVVPKASEPHRIHPNPGKKVKPRRIRTTHARSPRWGPQWEAAATVSDHPRAEPAENRGTQTRFGSRPPRFAVGVRRSRGVESAVGVRTPVLG